MAKVNQCIYDTPATKSSDGPTDDPLRTLVKKHGQIPDPLRKFAARVMDLLETNDEFRIISATVHFCDDAVSLNVTSPTRELNFSLLLQPD